MTNPFKTQVGGSHYKDLAYQPLEVGMVTRCPATTKVLKYLTRDKGGIADFEKAKHVAELYEYFHNSKRGHMNDIYKHGQISLFTDQFTSDTCLHDVLVVARTFLCRPSQFTLKQFKEFVDDYTVTKFK